MEQTEVGKERTKEKKELVDSREKSVFLFSWLAGTGEAVLQ